MALIDAVAKLLPGLAARYTWGQYDYREAKRAYEAAQPDNFRPRRASFGDGDRLVQQGATKIRGTARFLEENHDLVVGIIDDLVNNVIADGITMIPMVRDKSGALHEDMNRELRLVYDEWCRSPETTGELTMVPLERALARSLFRDGEVFTQQIRQPQFRYQTEIPFVLDTLEADFCPVDYTDAARSIMQGIERDQWGAARGFWFFKQHPGSLGNLTSSTLSSALVRRQAESILHLKLSNRLKQGRGMSILHAVIQTLRDIKDYEESERIAAKVASNLTGYVRRTEQFGRGASVTPGDNKRSLTMQAGMIHYLQPGEDIGMIKSDRPNAGLVDFRKALLKAVAAGSKTRFSSIARSYDGTYSSQRQELVEGAVSYRALFAYYAGAHSIPVHRALVDTVVLGGIVRTPRDVDLRTLYAVDCQAPALPWIDPYKEAQAWATLVQAQLESRAGIERMRGRDADAVFDEIEQEKARGFGIAQATAPAPMNGGAEDQQTTDQQVAA